MPVEKRNYVECGVKFKQKSNGYYIAIIYVPYKDDLKKPKKRYELSATSVANMREKIRGFIKLSNKCDVNLLYRGTFESYASEWLSKKKEIAERKGKLAGYERMEYSYRKYIFLKFGHMKLLDITLVDLQSFINDYGTAYSKSSTIKILDPIKQLFTYAYDHKHIPHNPTLLLHGLKDENYGSETKQVIALSREIQAQFEDICRLRCFNGKLKYRLGYAYILILNTGLRRGELLALKWEDIDFDKKQLSVNKAIVLRYENNSTKEIIEKPKTKNSIRNIPLNNKALDALSHLKELNKDSEWVVAKKDSSRVLLMTFSELLKKLLKTNHLPLFGPHVLRHTSATILLANGTNIKTVSNRLGHSSVNVTNRYVHALEDADIAAAETLEKKLNFEKVGQNRDKQA